MKFPKQFGEYMQRKVNTNVQPEYYTTIILFLQISTESNSGEEGWRGGRSGGGRGGGTKVSAFLITTRLSNFFLSSCFREQIQ